MTNSASFTTASGNTINVEFNGDDLVVIANGKTEVPVYVFDRNTKHGPALRDGTSRTIVPVPYESATAVEAVVNAYAAHVRAKQNATGEIDYKNHVKRISSID